MRAADEDATCFVDGCDEASMDGKPICFEHWVRLPFEYRPGWTKRCPNTASVWADLIELIESAGE